MHAGDQRREEPPSIRQQFSVGFDFPVFFGRDLLACQRSALADSLDRLNEPGRRRVLVFLDEGLAAATPGLPERVAAYFAAHAGRLELAAPAALVPGGEQAKQRHDVFEQVLEHIAAHHLCRQSTILALGGGSMLDIVGLAAALVHRGVRLVRMPTTVLSQNDSGVGVKNGIDAYGVKNFLGTFAPPFAVLVDFDFLNTLPEAYRLGGLAEAFKVAIIRDADFFKSLHRQAAALRAGDRESTEAMIRRCALLHLAHIREGGDPFEFGAARPLDFGHWAAHRLEVLSDYALGHGQAVAIGIALDSTYAWLQGLLKEHELRAVLDALYTARLPLWSPLLESTGADGRPALRRGLDDFREHLGGILHITLPAGIGHGIEVQRMDWNLIVRSRRYLKDFVAGRQARA